jgi:hypothetical protein
MNLKVEYTNPKKIELLRFYFPFYSSSFFTCCLFVGVAEADLIAEDFILPPFSGEEVSDPVGIQVVLVSGDLEEALVALAAEADLMAVVPVEVGIRLFLAV